MWVSFYARIEFNSANAFIVSAGNADRRYSRNICLDVLHQEKLINHPDLGVYGIFSTTKVEWKYYAISYNTNTNNKINLTSELCSYTQEATYESIAREGKEFKTLEDAKEFIQNYKLKWESGNNNTSQEIRDKKLNDLGV